MAIQTLYFSLFFSTFVYFSLLITFCYVLSPLALRSSHNGSSGTGAHRLLPFQYDLEVDQRMNLLRVSADSDGHDQLAAVQKRVAAVVAVGVTFERRVGSKVKLGGQRLVPRRGDDVVDVLADAARIMAGHHRIERIPA